MKITDSSIREKDPFFENPYPFKVVVKSKEWFSQERYVNIFANASTEEEAAVLKEKLERFVLEL